MQRKGGRAHTLHATAWEGGLTIVRYSTVVAEPHPQDGHLTPSIIKARLSEHDHRDPLRG